MWDIVWVSPQGHRSVSVSRHFLLQAPQCSCSVRKRFSRDHCCRGRSKPGCRIVGSHTRWELTTWADFQLCRHRLLMSAGCKSSHSGFLDVSRSNGGLSCHLNDMICCLQRRWLSTIWHLTCCWCIMSRGRRRLFRFTTQLLATCHKNNDASIRSTRQYLMTSVSCFITTQCIWYVNDDSDDDGYDTDDRTRLS